MNMPVMLSPVCPVSVGYKMQPHHAPGHAPSHAHLPLEGAGSQAPPPVDRNTPDYLAQLLNDKKLLQVFPNVFQHMEKILDEGRVWFLEHLAVTDLGLLSHVDSFALLNCSN